MPSPTPNPVATLPRSGHARRRMGQAVEGRRVNFDGASSNLVSEDSQIDLESRRCPGPAPLGGTREVAACGNHGGLPTP